MGRFTAYTSDISDDEDDDIHISSDDRPPSQPPPEAEEEEGSDSESSSSTSSDEMHEDELTRSPPRKAKTTRNALVQDEDGEIRYSHEVDGSHGRPMSSSPPLMREEPIPWAQQVGVDPQRMHVMQASLFRVPEEAEAMRAANKPKRSAWVLPQSLNRKHSRGSDGGGLRAEPREVRQNFILGLPGL
jgi:nuclear pore complex protein Nup98-Nup96